ncbi:MAG: hypothetical protein LIO94_03120 [Clostridiales bacterium]|nr:hypothetical protein [Clostridiales bacterium]
MKAKAWKRALSMVLALMMAFSLAVYPAYATNASGELLSEATALEPTAADDVDTVASESNSNAGIAMIGLDEDDETSVTLPEAVNGVITLTQDYALTESYVLNSGEVTIDLNGYSITRGEGNTIYYLIDVASGATLTVKDSSSGATGTIESSDMGCGILTNGTVTINSGTVSGYYSGVYVSGTSAALTVSGTAVVKSTVTVDMNNFVLWQASTCGISVNDGATATIDGGTVAGGYVGITVWEGNSADNPSTLIVNGGTISGATFGVSTNGNTHYTDSTVNGGTISGITGMYLPAMDSTTTINGGTITGTSTGIEIRAGSLTVNGGTITSTAESGTFEESGNDNGTTTVGAAIAVVQHTTKQAVTVTITDGSLSGYYGIFEADLQGNGTDYTQYVTISVSGGTISTTDTEDGTAIYHRTTSAASIPLIGGTYNTDPSAYVAKGYEAVDNGDGTWTVQLKTATASINMSVNMTLANSLAMNFWISKDDVDSSSIADYTLSIAKGDGQADVYEFVYGKIYAEAENFSTFNDYYIVRYTGYYAYEYESDLTVTLLKNGDAVTVTNNTFSWNGTENNISISSFLAAYKTAYAGNSTETTMADAIVSYCEAAKVYYDATTSKSN